MNTSAVPAGREAEFATWRSPASFTSLVPVANGTEPSLRDRLAELAPALEAAVAQVDDLHSFRLVVIPASTEGVHQLHLLMNLVHDRPLPEHLSGLVGHAGHLLVQAFAGATSVVSPLDLPALWARHRLRENTIHLGAVRRRLTDIRLERALREEIGAFADRALAEGRWPAGTPAETVRLEIRGHVLAQLNRGDLPSGPSPAISRSGRKAQFVDLLKTFAFPAMGTLHTDIVIAIGQISHRSRRRLTRAAYALWWLYGAIPTGIAILGVRWLELTEPDIELPPASAAKVQRLEEAEDVRLKNEVTYWFTVKPSWIRHRLMTLVLWGSERGCRHLWTRGALAGIDTIHYARLLQFAEKRVMLFMSDYDGSLDRYLLDFTGVGSRAVIPISSSVAGCPRTRWLYGKEDPVTFAPRLGNLLRTYQLETSVWYSAYPHLTVRDVLVNREIRDGLFAPKMSEEDARRWAELL